VRYSSKRIRARIDAARAEGDAVRTDSGGASCEEGELERAGEWGKKLATEVAGAPVMI
jgi:hypothetical protein